MIDLSDEKTWPAAILNLLVPRVIETRREREDDLAAHRDGRHWCIGYRGTPVNRGTEAELEAILRALEIRAFHCTRLADQDEVRRNGLELLTRNRQRDRVLAMLRRQGVQERLLWDTARAFDAYAEYNYREGQLWFALSKEATDDPGYADFFRFFGGEVTRRALYDLRDELFPILESAGVPAVVEAQLRISEGAGYQISNMAKEFIKYAECKFLDNERCAIECEMMIQHPVASASILDVWEKQLP